MNAKGLYDTEHMYKMAEIMKEGDEQRVINSRKVVDICAKGDITGIYTSSRTFRHCDIRARAAEISL